ncbi:MAG: murein L,D-transpeptidase family protein [Beijerinckiaceae bacterium]|nr:murein L,D-transpeptidase family protein [Beijerinckiaceae bacterium]
MLVSKTLAHALRLGAAASFLALASGAPALASTKASAPVPSTTRTLMASRDMAPTAPILVRVFKKESVLEVWKQTRAGRYEILKTFPICRWSGQLGPKRREGDRQAPEGFYSVGPKQMNPNSQFHLSFDIGYPNAFDRAHGGTGAYLMVHGQCTSSGCYAMTDAQIEEVYALAREAFAGGQRAFQFQAFPFRMTAENIARHRSDANIAFWRQLKVGYDHFEATRSEPRVSVAAGRYAFEAGDEKAMANVLAYRETEEQRIAKLVEDGAASVRTTYADGGMNAIFRALAAKSEPKLGVVSRPEALAFAGKEVVLVAARTPMQMALANAPAPPPRPTDLPGMSEASGLSELIAGASPILPAEFTPWPRLTFASRTD